MLSHPAGSIEVGPFRPPTGVSVDERIDGGLRLIGERDVYLDGRLVGVVRRWQPHQPLARRGGRANPVPARWVFTDLDGEHHSERAHRVLTKCLQTSLGAALLTDVQF